MTTPTESTGRSLECAVCSFESFEHHPDEGVYRVLFDAKTVAPTTAVIGAMATVTGKDPLEVEPLHSTIDPDALDTLFSRRNREQGDVHVRFELEGCELELSSYGCMIVRPAG